MIQDKNPDLFYRFVRGDAPIEDFYKTGAIRGTKKYDYGAYFLKGNALNPTGATNGRYIIVDADKLKLGSNPLYPNEGRNLSFNKPRLPAKFDSKFGIILPDNSGYGHPVLTPKKAPEFLESVNPANRRGIKIVTDTGKTLYDRITPFAKRPISTHVSNLATEAKILGNAKLPAATGKALGSAGAIWQMHRQYKAATGQLGKTKWDKEYGESDPLSLRPLYDAALGTGEFRSTINTPEWVVRNPLAAAIYGAASGGNQYSKAFVDAYIPSFLKQKP